MKHQLAILILLLAMWQGAWCQIAIYGDTRTNPEIHGKIIEQMRSHQPRLVIHTGDLSSKGVAQREYDSFFTIVKPLSDLAPFYAVKGNHEKSRELFIKNFPHLGAKGYTKIEHEGLMIYLLDSTQDLTPGSAQDKWFREALGDSLPGIVVLHHPVFSSGYHGGDQALQMFLPQLLKKGRILAVFSGHDHDYERSEYQGIHYLVSAGGGSPQRKGRSPNPYCQVFENSYHYLILNHVDKGWKAEVWDLEGRRIDSFILDTARHD